MKFKEEVDIDLVRWVTENGYAPDLTDIEVVEVGRDPFLVAYAPVNADDRSLSRPNVRGRAHEEITERFLTCADSSASARAMPSRSAMNSASEQTGKTTLRSEAISVHCDTELSLGFIGTTLCVRLSLQRMQSPVELGQVGSRTARTTSRPGVPGLRRHKHVRVPFAQQGLLNLAHGVSGQLADDQQFPGMLETRQ